jgi:hypothetical protein
MKENERYAPEILPHVPLDSPCSSCRRTEYVTWLHTGLDDTEILLLDISKTYRDKSALE